MTMQFDRPTLSAEERAALVAAEGPLRTAKAVLADLHEIGFDVADDLAWADHQEQLRTGLLGRFSSQRPTRRSR